MKEQLIDRLKQKQSKIAIIGLGYVGLPLAFTYIDAGYQVLGVDIDKDKIKQLLRGQSYIPRITEQQLLSALDKQLECTSDISCVTEADAIILCVPTPLSKYREPDLSFVTLTVESLLPHLRVGQIVSLESTTYPGTTEEVLKPALEMSGLKVGQDIFLAYSPEREDPGNERYTTRTIPKVCSGMTPACLEVAIALYEQAIDTVVPVSTPATAEMTKLLENIHRAVNIGLVNELKIVAEKMNIDIYEVIRAASTKPFGFVPYYPGPGIGGHCIPVDPFYLTWKAREYGLHTRFIELAGEINGAMPNWVVRQITKALNDRYKPVKGAKILVIGLAYKRNVNDVRESPSIIIMEKLRERGAQVAYSDPFVPKFPLMRKHQFNLASTELHAETIKSFDCIVIATAHDQIDYELLQQHAQLIIDTRGIYSQVADNIVHA